MTKQTVRFYTSYYHSAVGKIAIMTMDNGHDCDKANTFSEAALISLDAALDEVLLQHDLKGLMLTGKHYTFAAGPMEAPSLTAGEQGYRNGSRGHAVMKRIMELPFPTLAAINGVALGGGLEIALSCGYRTVAKGVRDIGFPECLYGLIPCWGGCTLATKVLGLEKAIELIVFHALDDNRMIDGPQAFAMGLADRIFEGVGFLDETLQFLLRIIAEDIPPKRVHTPPAQIEMLLSAAKAFVDERVQGGAPAPSRALALMEGACVWDAERCFEEEIRAIRDLMAAGEHQASLWSLAHLDRYAKKPYAFNPELIDFVTSRPYNFWPFKRNAVHG